MKSYAENLVGKIDHQLEKKIYVVQLFLIDIFKSPSTYQCDVLPEMS